MFFEAIFAPIKVAFAFTSKKIPYIIFKILCLIIFAVPYLLFVVADILVNVICAILRYLPIIGFIFNLICWIFDIFPVLFFHLLILPDLICNKEEIKIILKELEHREELDSLTNLFLHGNITAEEYMVRKNWIVRQ